MPKGRARGQIGCLGIVLALVALAPLARAAPRPEPEVKAAAGPEMLPVPAGCFTMGQDSEGEMDERPAHEVCVSGFLLDRTEVTNAAYRECVKAKACPRPRKLKKKHFGGPLQPVVGVRWDNAKAYCSWKGKRLPTEAEWEFAARGPDNRRYAWGDTPPPDETLACFGWARHGPAPVGSYPRGAGPFGHLDLTGNVWEWVNDVYHPGYYAISPKQDPPGGTCKEAVAFCDELRRKGKRGFTGSNPIPDVCERVLRGGAWNYKGAGLRATNRVHHAARFRINVAGFRCAKDLEAKAPGSSASQPSE